jgi:hypothetical protein
VLDRPLHGRLFFEQVMRENLDLGRPEEIKLTFKRRIPRRRRTRARFAARIVTQDVTPLLNAHYKNARIKPYHKENRALRTEPAQQRSFFSGQYYYCVRSDSQVGDQRMRQFGGQMGNPSQDRS